ncbi:Adenosylhomocysteinase [Klebsiella pneumoniae IS43]|uniref:Adenosylhomocysteinase n=1 Tax=Klebsiella pneumoniae IS43 TaxID=1432552 RepID=W1DIL6_KLEPN|nr:Adenosylhomocysteinase [Klebsiella pneumoniae IS43]
MRIEGHNPVNNKISLAKEVAWASQNMPRTLRQVAALPTSAACVWPAVCTST